MGSGKVPIEQGIYAASCTLHCKTKHFTSGQFDNRFPSNAQAVTQARVVEQKSERNEKNWTEHNISKEKNRLVFCFLTHFHFIFLGSHVLNL